MAPVVYEYVQDSVVVERVQPVDVDAYPGDSQSYESTRLGLAVLEAQAAAERGELGDHWRIAGEEITNVEPPAEPPADSPAAEPVSAGNATTRRAAPKPKE